MAEDQAQVTEQAQGTEALNAEAVQSMISEAVAKVQEQTKGEIAGLNRRNSELEKALEDTKAKAQEQVQSTMTEAEKAQHELQVKMEETLQRLDRAEHAARLAENKEIARAKLKEAGLPETFMQFMSVESEDAITSSVEKGKGLLDQLRQEEAARQSAQVGTDVPATPVADGKNTIKLAEFENKTPMEQMEFVKAGGVVI